MSYKEEWVLYYEYLEMVRLSGVNMYGATPYLVETFDLKLRDARTILASWMENYDQLKQDGVI